MNRLKTLFAAFAGLSLFLSACAYATTTSYEGYTYLVQSQSQPHIVVNGNSDISDKAVAGIDWGLALTLTTNTTLTSPQAGKAPWLFTGSLGAGATVTIPAKTLTKAVSNATGQTLTFSTGSGTTATLTTGSRAVLICDGTNVYTIGSTSTSFSSPTFTGTVTFPGTNQTFDGTHWLLGFASDFSGDLVQINGGAYVNGTVAGIHLRGVSSAPSASPGAGAGTGGTCTVSGTDSSGQITVASGTLPAGSATVCTLTYANAYAITTHPVISAANSSAAGLSGVTMVYGDGTTTTLVITASATGIGASTTFKWNYMVIQ